MVQKAYQESESATPVSVLLGVDKNRRGEAVTMVLFLIDEDDVRSPPPSWRDGGDGRRKKRQDEDGVRMDGDGGARSRVLATDEGRLFGDRSLQMKQPVATDDGDGGVLPAVVGEG
ncbi:hypothetical protein Dimus_009078 [Dionaea muscipula]